MPDGQLWGDGRQAVFTHHPDPVVTGGSVTAANDEEGEVCSETILLAYAGPSRVWACGPGPEGPHQPADYRGMPAAGED
jgi:hypothetical protein